MKRILDDFGGAEHAPLKCRKPLLFRAIHQAVKDSPGGVAALAVTLGRNEKVIADAINPNSMDKVPSLDVFLTLLSLFPSSLVVNTLLDGTGFSVVRRGSLGRGDVFEHYMAMVQKTSAATSSGALALADKHLTESERLEWLSLLHGQQSATADLIEVIRGA